MADDSSQEGESVHLQQGGVRVQNRAPPSRCLCCFLASASICPSVYPLPPVLLHTPPSARSCPHRVGSFSEFINEDQRLLGGVVHCLRHLLDRRRITSTACEQSWDVACPRVRPVALLLLLLLWILYHQVPGMLTVCCQQCLAQSQNPRNIAGPASSHL